MKSKSFPVGHQTCHIAIGLKAGILQLLAWVLRVGVGARVGVGDGEAVGFAVGVGVGGVFSC